MRILQINTIYKFKSTGRTCAELEQFLVQNGHQCITAYGHGPKHGGNTYRINTKFEYYLHNLLSRITGLEGYFSYFATRRLIRFIKKFSPDVIHLGSLHGHYLHLPLLFKWLAKSRIPVILHLHDCWIFTGKCAHPLYHQCDKWLTSCRNCPAKKDYPASYLLDRSHKMFKDKKRWLSKLDNVTVVGVSEWIAGEAKKSFLNRFPIKTVYNWIDDAKFYPRTDCKPSDFGLNNDKFTVVCAGSSWATQSDKGRDLLALADALPEDMQILLVGAADEGLSHPRIISVGFTNDIDRLARMYSVSNAYVHLSTADTFGKVIAEAMACGLPAIVYNVTACPEVVGPDCGFAVPLHDVNAVVDKLRLIQIGTADYAVRCPKRVKQNFHHMTNMQQTLNLYEAVIRPAD